MSLKVINGAKIGPDSANNTPDIAHADRTNTTVNSAGVLMNDDLEQFAELIVMIDTGVMDASHTLNVHVQESDDNSTYTNISGASVALDEDDDNQVHVIDVDWKHPDRKKYARVSAISGATNSGAYGVRTLRVQPGGGNMDVDSVVTEV